MTAIDPDLPGQIVMREQPGLQAAILAVQSEAPALPRDKTATVATAKGQYSYSYTDLATIVERVGPILRRHGLVWSTFPTIAPGGQTALRYRLLHVPTGESDEDTMPLLLAKDDSQGMGSAITYARRYALVAVLNLIADEDDDGQAATYHRESRARPSAPDTDTVDMRDGAKGLRDEAINAAREAMGWPKLEKPWASLMNVPAEKAADFMRALDAARAAQ